jgi:hypothetical protein
MNAQLPKGMFLPNSVIHPDTAKYLNWLKDEARSIAIMWTGVEFDWPDGELLWPKVLPSTVNRYEVAPKKFRPQADSEHGC